MNSTLLDVTQRIITRSHDSRQQYLNRIAAARNSRVHRTQLACGNLAHGFAACGSSDKHALKNMLHNDIAIITAYNDMLSAHQPYERYPEVLRHALREVGAVGQVVGGVPAMCDGITQGQDGMELSLLSRRAISSHWKRGEITLLVDDAELQQRSVTHPDLSVYHMGCGRELFAALREHISGAEQGAACTFL